MGTTVQSKQTYSTAHLLKELIHESTGVDVNSDVIAHIVIVTLRLQHTTK